MAKRFKYLLATSLLLMSASLFGFTLTRAHAATTLDPKGQACEALGAASNTTGDCTTSSGPDVSSTLKLAINAFSLIVGVAAVIMIIVGGFKYVISQGEGANTAGAKNTILYAIVGLVVVALAQAIVVFVLSRTSNPCPPPRVLQSDGACVKP